MKTIITIIILCFGFFASAQPANNCECVAPDNGSGTIDIPPLCPDSTDIGDPLFIIDGLPPGTTIEIEGVINNHLPINSVPGGSLGGESHAYSASLQMEMTGTGDLAGFNRLIQVPISVELHSGQRNPGDPIQIFPLDIFTVQWAIFGDPDFDQLQITAGTWLGLPGPGNMTLTELTGEFNVESFYDLNYQIDFVGAPGSVLEALSGSSQSSSRFSVGSECVLPPIPTMSQWEIVILSLLMLAFGLIFVRNQIGKKLGCNF